MEPTFKKEDVWRVAASIGDGLYIDEGGRNAYLVCAHCCRREYFSWQDDESKQRKDFTHSTDCLTKVATDLLTGAPKEVQ